MKDGCRAEKSLFCFLFYPCLLAHSGRFSINAWFKMIICWRYRTALTVLPGFRKRMTHDTFLIPPNAWFSVFWIFLIMGFSWLSFDGRGKAVHAAHALYLARNSTRWSYEKNMTRIQNCLKFSVVLKITVMATKWYKRLKYEPKHTFSAVSCKN